MIKSGKNSIKYIDTLIENLDIDREDLREVGDCEGDDCPYASVYQLIKDNEFSPSVIKQIANESNMSMDEVIKLMYETLHKIFNDDRIDEMMSTSTVAGAEEYATPYAFSNSEEPSDKIKKISRMFGMTPVKKSNKWFKKFDDKTSKPINEDIQLDTSLYKRMIKINKGDI